MVEKLANQWLNHNRQNTMTTDDKRHPVLEQIKQVSEWLLFNANSAIFQLYHDENKLIFNEMMMMRSTLY